MSSEKPQIPGILHTMMDAFNHLNVTIQALLTSAETVATEVGILFLNAVNFCLIGNETINRNTHVIDVLFSVVVSLPAAGGCLLPGTRPQGKTYMRL